jgi:DNA-directed RNA polymerase subunit RPC12/RpoP
MEADKKDTPAPDPADFAEAQRQATSEEMRRMIEGALTPPARRTMMALAGCITAFDAVESEGEVTVAMGLLCAYTGYQTEPTLEQAACIFGRVISTSIEGVTPEGAAAADFSERMAAFMTRIRQQKAAKPPEELAYLCEKCGTVMQRVPVYAAQGDLPTSWARRCPSCGHQVPV